MSDPITGSPPLDVITGYLVVEDCHVLSPCGHAMSSKTYQTWTSETKFHDYCPFCYEPDQKNYRITGTTVYNLTGLAKSLVESNGSLQGSTIEEIKAGHERVLNSGILKTRYANPGCELPDTPTEPVTFWILQVVAISTVVDAFFALHKL